MATNTHRLRYLPPPPDKPDLAQQPFCVPCHLWPTTSATSVRSACAASFQVTALALKAHGSPGNHKGNFPPQKTFTLFKRSAVSIHCWQPNPQLKEKRADPFTSQFLPHVCCNSKSSGIFLINILRTLQQWMEEVFSSTSADYWTSALCSSSLLPQKTLVMKSKRDRSR